MKRVKPQLKGRVIPDTRQRLEELEQFEEYSLKQLGKLNRDIQINELRIDNLKNYTEGLRNRFLDQLKDVELELKRRIKGLETANKVHGAIETILIVSSLASWLLYLAS